MGAHIAINCLPAITIEFAAITIDVAVFAAKIAAFVARSGVVAVVEFAAKLRAVVGNPDLVMADVTAEAMATVPGKRGGYTHSDEQQDPGNRVFHIFSSDPSFGC
jgi:hypothetical protein